MPLPQVGKPEVLAQAAVSVEVEVVTVVVVVVVVPKARPNRLLSNPSGREKPD